ncbi:phosphotransferase [Nocardia sp. 348MFTsu5.1]|uniref:phosphotransferase n=1 Tax=Nocardia sp. 348MFTsu5.1 TaxID=1172185 RepID=UPI00037FD853|nr:phosphotransferase [Nocardia sp. 348MFTsu5.1]
MIELPTPDESTLCDVAQRLKIGRYVDHSSEPLDFDVAAPGTAGLWRVRIRGDRGQGTAVVKVLRHPVEWPPLAEFPPEAREFFLQTFPWSQDPEVLAEVAPCCPEGFRTVELLGAQWHGPHLRSMWLEDLGDVQIFSTAAQFERAARLLGAMAGIRAAAGSALSQQFDDGFALAMIARERVEGMDRRLLAGMMDDPDDHVVPRDLVEDLLWVGDHIDRLLRGLGELPQTPVHGDAAPDNLVVDPGDDRTIVLIDLAQMPRHAVGFDLGQLVFGRHSPVLALGEDVVDRIVDEYAAGLAVGGMPVDASVVWAGFVGSAVIRNAFEVAGATTDVPGRIAAARYLVNKAFDLGLVPCREAAR